MAGAKRPFEIGKSALPRKFPPNRPFERSEPVASSQNPSTAFPSLYRSPSGEPSTSSRSSFSERPKSGVDGMRNKCRKVTSNAVSFAESSIVRLPENSISRLPESRMGNPPAGPGGFLKRREFSNSIPPSTTVPEMAAPVVKVKDKVIVRETESDTDAETRFYNIVADQTSSDSAKKLAAEQYKAASFAKYVKAGYWAKFYGIAERAKVSPLQGREYSECLLESLPDIVALSRLDGGMPHAFELFFRIMGALTEAASLYALDYSELSRSCARFDEVMHSLAVERLKSGEKSETWLPSTVRGLRKEQNDWTGLFVEDILGKSIDLLAIFEDKTASGTIGAGSGGI